MTDALADHKQRLNGFLRTCGECIDDLKINQKGVPIYYNIDFSLLCPILFNFEKAPPGSKDYLISEKASMRRVLDKAPNEGHFELVISGATVVEFFDQLHHRFQFVTNRIPSLRNQFPIKDLKDEALIRKGLATSADIRRDLALFTQEGIDQQLRAPINRLLKLLDTHKVQGIGDVLDGNEVRKNTDKSLFDEFLAEQRARRHDGRSPEDRLFHQRVDSANNCLTMAASQLIGVRAPFVTTTALNMKQCTIDGQVFARVARTPLFLLNLYKLKANREIGDELAFLDSAVRETMELLNELEAYGHYDNVPDGIKLRLARLVGTSVAMLSKGSRDDEAGAEHLEEIMNNLSDQKRLQEIVDSAMQDAKDGAQLLEMHSARFDLPYLDEFDFSNDPVIARIKKDLGVGLKQQD